MSISPQRVIAEACEIDLENGGDTYLGADSAARSQRQVDTRYGVMLDVIRDESSPASVLDLGCGPAHLLDFVQRTHRRNIAYTGIDLSPKPLRIARARHPSVDFLELDVLAPGVTLPSYDYVIMCGVFKWRGPIPEDEMLAYWQRMVSFAFAHARIGIAFNVMSKIVDWERDDLFHLPLDRMAAFVSANLSRQFVVRHDYGDFEYTTYVYRDAWLAPERLPTSASLSA